jgi:hypothetical protein
MQKKEAQGIHAKRRAYERYDIALANKDLKIIVKRIQNGNAIFIRRQSLRITIWATSICNTVVKVAYDRIRKQIVTFLI